uniref:AIG1-type G domain-containing protein n=1 Tax=Knipowitschia caucasica TaxID=637954 RepID=A0AAV2J0T4_KNICA
MARPSSIDSTFDGEIRVVLIGKTGNGKSASGNTLLNQNVFASVLSPSSVTSESQKSRGTVHGRRLAVIDTPGIFDTKYKEKEVVQKLKTCISMSAPGPHAFLIVINLTRFTEEEQKSVELIQHLFGPKATEYSMVLFTHVLAFAEAGVAIGTGAGTVCGPVGMGVGAVVGGLAGVALGLVPAAVVAIKNQCVTQ